MARAQMGFSERQLRGRRLALLLQRSLCPFDGLLVAARFLEQLRAADEGIGVSRISIQRRVELRQGLPLLALPSLECD